MDLLGESDDEEGYTTPNEVTLPESPVVETTSGSDSAVLVNYAGGDIWPVNRFADPRGLIEQRSL